jgi:hypothetical protein
VKLTSVVAQHGFTPSDLGEIHNAKLYQRENSDGALELLCVQKIGNVMKVNHIALMNLMGMMIPMNEPLDQIIPKEKVEEFLNAVLTQ